jgi:N-acetylneuraminate synthase
MEIPRIANAYKAKVADIGFSGHHLGIAVDIAAYTLGASWVERHFTKDRTWKGTDHAASLEFAGLQKLARDLNAVYRSLSTKSTEILAIEQVQRDKLKYRG